MLKTLWSIVVIIGLTSFSASAQDELFLEHSSTLRLDSLRKLLPDWKDTIVSTDLDIALEIRKSSKKYALDHHVYTHIVRCALKTDSPELAERYARELFPAFQLLHLNRKRMNRGIESRNVCFLLSNYYYEKGDFRKGNYYCKLTLVRFLARFCGTGAETADYRLMLQLIDRYNEADQLLKAKHWQRKAKRYHRRHLE